MARYQGHCEAINAADLTVNEALQINAINTEEAGYQATQEILQQDDSIDAIVCASDVLASGALAALKKQGIDVPRQVSVVGFDDILLARYTSPTLTTCRQDTKQAGKLLVDKLVGLIKGEDVSASSVIKTELVIRESCGQ